MESNRIVCDPAPERTSFRVEARAEWLQFSFEFDRHESWIFMNVWDPEGRIRFSYLDVNRVGEVTVHRDPLRTSELAIPGDIPSGEWHIEFVRGKPKTLALTWRTGSGALPAAAEGPPEGEWDVWSDGHAEHSAGGSDDGAYVLNRYDWTDSREGGRRWYRGDFHTHTALSDGEMTAGQLTGQAAVRGLDFFAITDHNIMPHRWPKSGVRVIPGIEITSFGKGDWNAIGLDRWPDWRHASRDGGIGTQEGMDRLMAEAGSRGALRSLNHPLTVPWAWMFADTPLSELDALEIVNTPTDGANTEKMLVVWSAAWNEGVRLTGLGGSDVHGAPKEGDADAPHGERIGLPATYVEAEALSASAIVNAARAGRAYVSLGPVLEIEVAAGRRPLRLGGDTTEAVDESDDGKVRVRLAVSGLDAGSVNIIENGGLQASLPIEAPDQTFEIELDWRGEAYRWARLEIRDPAGALRAFTNPVFYGNREAGVRTWRQLLERAGFEMPVNARN
ncbi:CehA/McbA family metallohydrolase [Cohnella sp. GCM10020058]|uniref:CehA/McbA family metallohydrolase n=1 Tax=Cohnella sp. GCM10020058 TaxID=3317330 RepID=UPI003625FCA5